MNGNKFTVITPTGDRPESFQLCQCYVDRQTLLPDQWIIVDDGIKEMQSPNLPYVEYVRRTRKPNEPRHTLTLNMLEALPRVRNDIVMIVEDDDWYREDYFERMLEYIDGCVLACQADTIYYSVPTRTYVIHKNREHGSWCQTVFRKQIIPQIQNICRGNDQFIDMKVWRLNVPKRIAIDEVRFSIGMKGLPGRMGIGSGHTRNGLPLKDASLLMLQQCIGKDIELYRRFIK